MFVVYKVSEDVPAIGEVGEGGKKVIVEDDEVP